MRSAARPKYLAWKTAQKNKISSLRNEKRQLSARLRWAKQAATWGHEHPKR
ncbi:MAG: hypothetical protein AB1485_04055 [Candidatus Thermoplasmatota archaeon]